MCTNSTQQILVVLKRVRRLVKLEFQVIVLTAWPIVEVIFKEDFNELVVIALLIIVEALQLVLETNQFFLIKHLRKTVV